MLAEVEVYLGRIEDIRGQVRDLIEGLSADALNWRPVEGTDDHATNSLAVLAAHSIGAEHFWIGEVVGGLSATRNRDAEFQTEIAGPEGLLNTIDQIGEETRKVIRALTQPEIEASREVRSRTFAVRWAILHVIDHTSLHLGHMQLTLQLYQSGKGAGSPRWFERVDK